MFEVWVAKQLFLIYFLKDLLEKIFGKQVSPTINRAFNHKSQTTNKSVLVRIICIPKLRVKVRRDDTNNRVKLRLTIETSNMVAVLMQKAVQLSHRERLRGQFIPDHDTLTAIVEPMGSSSRFVVLGPLELRAQAIGKIVGKTRLPYSCSSPEEHNNWSSSYSMVNVHVGEETIIGVLLADVLGEELFTFLDCVERVCTGEDRLP